MRSARLAAALCGSLLVMASCGRDSAPQDGATPASADAACVERGCYSAEDIGPVIADGPWATSIGINSHGMAVGTTPRWSSDPDPRRAFVYRGGTASPLGNLGAPRSEARAVNEWGYAVGGSDDGAHWRAASFFHGVVTDLGSLDGSHSWAMDVNNAGFAVGGGFVSGLQHAAGFFLGKAFDFGSLGGDTCANGVNDLFEVVGSTQLADGTWSGFALRKGKLVRLDALGIPAPSDAQKINNRGTICGQRSGPGFEYSTAFLLHRNGTLVDLEGLGYPYSWCLDVNDDGVAVGVAVDVVNGWRAVAWLDPSQPPADLNLRVVPPMPDVQLVFASGISSSGMISAYGWLPSTDEHRGYILRPTACPR